MIYVVLWIESLAACVLGVLWGFTCWQQFTRVKSLGRAAVVLTVMFAVCVCGLQLLGSGVLYASGLSTNYLAYSISFTAVLLVLVVWLLIRGFRRNGDERRIAAWPLGRIGIATLACSALYLTTLMTTDTTMQMKLANVRLEAGTLAMSEAPPRPVERENAALVYARAFERIDAWKNSDAQKDWVKNYTSLPAKWSDLQFDAKRPELRDYLAKTKTALDLMRRAASMPACAFDRAFATPSLAMPLPELGKLRECSRMLAIDARVRAADGDIKGALEDIHAINGISEHLSYEPLLISGLVSVACQNIATETLDAVLRTSEPSAADIEAAWKNDDFFTFRRAYLRCMRGERAFGLSAFAMAGDSSYENVLNMLESVNRDSYSLSLIARIATPYWRVYLLPADLRSYNEAMEMMERSGTYTFRLGKDSLKSLESREHPRDGILTGMLVPSLSRSFQMFHTAEARLQLTALARAVCLYRAKNKAFPKDLDALVPEFISDIPADPFDDKPLRMKVHAAGVTLYSVGGNETDDGGVADPHHDFDKGDVILRIGNVPDAAPPGPATQPGATKPAAGSF